MTATKHIPANCDRPLSGSGLRRCKWAGIVETEDGRMVCGHHAKMIAEDTRGAPPATAGPPPASSTGRRI